MKTKEALEAVRNGPPGTIAVHVKGLERVPGGVLGIQIPDGMEPGEWEVVLTRKGEAKP